MAWTLGITGMDSDTEAEIQAAFKIANTECAHRWTLVEADAADYVVIDMDSLYGPMSWLRLHSAGQKVIGLTEKTHGQTDYRLPRPLHSSDFAALLLAIVNGSAGSDAAAAAAATDRADPVSHHTQASDTQVPAPAPAPSSAAASPVVAAAPETSTPPAPTAALADSEKPETAAQPRLLAEWLHGSRQRLRLQRDTGPILLIDTDAGVWHGPGTLKPLLGYFQTPLSAADFSTPTADAWAAEAAALGAAQPLTRLHWLGGLLSDAALDGQYQLEKWPQTEREYPKHFRIATVMMKGPANVAEIAEASHVSTDEVEAFIKANLATGYARRANATPPPGTDDSQRGGLFGRRRGA